MKLDRLLGILTVLLQKERVTAPYLAERFEVSRRTISRDVDALCQAGIPLITQQGGGGGISIASGYKLDKSVLTTDELSGIIAALKGIGTVGEKSQTEKTLNKLSAHKDQVVSLREPIVIDLASHYKGNLTEKIQLIKGAVLEQRLIEFDYYYQKGMQHRRIEPCFVIFRWSAWYVFGFCTLRQDFRMFKIQRLWEPRVCDERFTPREIPPERQDFDSFLSDGQKFVALFDASNEYKLIEMYGFSAFTYEKDGRLRLEVGYTNEDVMLSWVLGFGDQVTVLHPRSMAKDIARIAENIVRRYN